MNRILFVIAWMLSFSVSQAQMEDDPEIINKVPGLDIEARLGFGLFSGSNKPIALTAMIRNNTNKTIKGRLVVSDRWGGNQLDLGELYLAAGQVRKFCAIRNVSNWGNPRLSLISDEQTIWQQPLSWLNYMNNQFQNAHQVGILHDGSQEHQFRLELPVTSIITSNGSDNFSRWNNSVQMEFTDAGYQLQTANIRTWQIPDHFGPLEPLRAMIVLESVDPDNLNGAQKEAIGKWIATGGCLYLPVTSEELLAALQRTLPFPLGPATVTDTLAVRRCGQGQIVLYPDTLFGSNTATAEETVYRSIASLPTDASRPLFSVELLSPSESYGRSTTRAILMIYFFGYLALCAVPIIFVTSNWKKKVLPYTVGLVACGCVAAIAVGATLRTSTGESRWLTLTVPTENGTVQYADIEVRSTGGIKSNVAVTGESPDLQSESPTQHRYYYDDSTPQGLNFEAFDKQSNELDSDDSFRTEAGIAPWGTQRLRATDFAPEIPAPEVSLVLKKSPSKDTFNGQLSFRYSGPQILELMCLHIQTVPRRGGNGTICGNSTIINEPQKEALRQFPVTLQLNQSKQKLRWPDLIQHFSIKDCTAPGETRAFLIGRLSDSPSLQLNESESDFVLDHGVHFWMYEIPKDQIQIQGNIP